MCDIFIKDIVMEALVFKYADDNPLYGASNKFDRAKAILKCNFEFFEICLYDNCKYLKSSYFLHLSKNKNIENTLKFFV